MDSGERALKSQSRQRSRHALALPWVADWKCLEEIRARDPRHAASGVRGPGPCTFLLPGQLAEGSSARPAVDPPQWGRHHRLGTEKRRHGPPQATSAAATARLSVRGAALRRYCPSHRRRQDCVLAIPQWRGGHPQPLPMAVGDPPASRAPPVPTAAAVHCESAHRQRNAAPCHAWRSDRPGHSATAQHAPELRTLSPDVLSMVPPGASRVADRWSAGTIWTSIS